MRQRAFTLIELLVVIAILLMLMMIMLPAVAKAREAYKIVRAKAQVGALAKACASYQLIFDSPPPGPFDDPPGAGTRISGCQNLWLGLIGCTRSGIGGSYTALSPSTGGPYGNIDTATDQHPIFYSPRKGEYKDHSAIYPRSSSATYINCPVIIDQAFAPAERPVLYYRLRSTTANVFNYDANAVYCKTNEGYSGAEELTNWIDASSPTARAIGFAILSPGPDRAFFTKDDICSWK